MTKATSSTAASYSLAEKLGKNISFHRHHWGWTQQQLAEKIGVDSVTVSRIETGSSLPSLTRLAAIADALDITLSELVSGVSPHVTDHARAIADCLAPLREDDRYLLTETLRQLAERLKGR